LQPFLERLYEVCGPESLLNEKDRIVMSLARTLAVIVAGAVISFLVMATAAHLLLKPVDLAIKMQNASRSKSDSEIFQRDFQRAHRLSVLLINPSVGICVGLFVGFFQRQGLAALPWRVSCRSFSFDSMPTTGLGGRMRDCCPSWVISFSCCCLRRALQVTSGNSETECLARHD
jgi:hypothetical protein